MWMIGYADRLARYARPMDKHWDNRMDRRRLTTRLPQSLPTGYLDFTHIPTGPTSHQSELTLFKKHIVLLLNLGLGKAQIPGGTAQGAGGW